MGKGSNTTTQTSSPNSAAMGAYNQLLQRAGNVGNLPYTPYSGQLVAPVNAQQQTGIGNINANAGFAQPYIQQAAGYANAAAQPITGQDIANYQNPYTQQVVGSTLGSLNQFNAMQQQQVLGNAASAGALGGDRLGIAQATLAGQQAQQEAPIIAGLYSQGYGQASQMALAEQQARANAAYSLGNLGVAGQQAGLSGAGAQIGAGSLEQQTQQQQLAALYGQFQIGQAFPYQQTQWLAGLDTGVGSQMGGTSTTVGPPPNPFNTIAGLGAAGFGAYLKSTGANRGGGISGFADGGTPMAGSPYGGVAGYIPGLNITPGRGAPQSPQIPGMANPGANFPNLGGQFLGQSLGKSGGASPGAVTDYGSETTGFAPEGGIDMSGMGLFDPAYGAAADVGAADAGAMGAVDLGATAAEAGAGFSIADLLPLLALAKRGGRIQRRFGGVAGFDNGGGVSFEVKGPRGAGQRFADWMHRHEMPAAIGPYEPSMGIKAVGEQMFGLAPSQRIDRGFAAINDPYSGYRHGGVAGYDDGGAVDEGALYQQGLDLLRERMTAPQPQKDQSRHPIALPPPGPPPGPIDVPGRAFANGTDLPPEITGGVGGGPQMPAQALSYSGDGSGAGAGLGPSPSPAVAQSAPVAPASSRSSWGDALITAGLGMMASKSPFAGVAIGEGGLAGMQTYLGQEQQKVSNAQKQQSLDTQIRHLDQAAEQSRAHIAMQTKQLEATTDLRKAQMQQTGDLRRDMLGIQQQRLDQGNFKPTGSTTEDGHPVLYNSRDGSSIDGITGEKIKPDAKILNPKQAGIWSDATKKFYGEMLAAGAAMPPGVARGNPQNIADAMEYAVQAFHRDHPNATGADLAAARANFTAQSSAARVAANREATVGAAVEEARGTFPVALQAVNAYGQSNFVPWNKAVNMFQAGTSDPKLKAMVTSLQGSITTYSQAMSRTGTNSVNAQQHAEKLLGEADGPRAIAAALHQMDLEMDEALKAPERVREKILAHISGRPYVERPEIAPGPQGGGGGSSPPASAAGMPPPAQRETGKVYQTPSGKRPWTGAGWGPVVQ